MKKEFYVGGIIPLFVFAQIYVSTASAQNVTTNVSEAAGNASAGVNQTGSNVSEAAGNASAGVNQTASELGKNASEVG
jgi:hypothetical protein